jgi:putative membrane protein
MKLMGHSTEPQEQGNKSILRLVSSGFAMGAADVVPGVSGGTIAFILGIYEDLLHAIHAVDMRFFRLLLKGRVREAFSSASWRFLFAVGSGLLLALFTISRVLVWALDHFPTLVWAFFFGLVLASVWVVSKRVRRWSPGVLLIAGVSTVAAFFLVGMVPVETPDAPWFLFLSGAVAISAMILPGISGAFILLILGKYQFLLESFVSGNWLPLIFVVAGAAVGILTFARLLRWLFLHYHDLTVALLTGLILGALRKVWPWKASPEADNGPVGHDALVLEMNVVPTEISPEVALALAVMLLGFGIVLVLEYYGKR